MQFWTSCSPIIPWHVGSLFYLTSIVCCFLLLASHIKQIIWPLTHIAEYSDRKYWTVFVRQNWDPVFWLICGVDFFHLLWMYRITDLSKKCIIYRSTGYISMIHLQTTCAIRRWGWYWCRRGFVQYPDCPILLAMLM